jgi:hypothetical protein
MDLTRLAQRKRAAEARLELLEEEKKRAAADFKRREATQKAELKRVKELAERIRQEEANV